MQYRGTYTQVDLSAIAANAAKLKQSIAPTPHMMAVVKANAYGHGLVPVSRAGLAHGADWLGVAIPEEGETLRQAGITAPVLVLGAVNAQGAEAGVCFGLTMTVFDVERVRLIEQAAQRQGKVAQVHLKCDTGMGRIGVRNEAELRAVLDAIEQSHCVQLTGAFTHFADADGESDGYSFRQMERFAALRALLPDQILVHAAASAAGARYPLARYDMVREGIALYGCAPVKECPSLRPALSWHTEIAYIKTLPAGECVSYGCTYQTAGETKVATLPVGYGDGYHRALSGKAQVLIGGVRCPVIGRVCMDQIMVDVTHVPEKEAHLGADCVLLGRQGNEEITAAELAAWADTISYEMLLAATARVPVHTIGETGESDAE
ncbi:MAG: alanine racemase [Clostridia bacterium]|nr:alanine racemase [Clostridia bacterium]